LRVRFGHPIGRRAFLGLAGFGAAMVALSRLRMAPAAVAAQARHGLRVLRSNDARVLTAIADRMVHTGDPSMPRFGDTPGIFTVDTALLQLPAETSRQLHWALLLFEYAPPVFSLRFSTFTGLSDEAKDDYIAGWAESRFLTRQFAFRALKNLSLLGYYAQDATWKGIHYGGPWVPRPRRVIES
jgi:hypothetical protein